MNKETENKHSTYNAIMERRRNLRMPVDMLTLSVDVKGQSSAFVYKTHIVNISRSGMCLEWNCCSDCSGYKAGEIHPDCIFWPYGDENPEGRELMFYITMPWTDKVVDFKGKAVYTFKHDDVEHVGIVFTDITDRNLELLEQIIRKTDSFIKKKYKTDETP